MAGALAAKNRCNADCSSVAAIDSVDSFFAKDTIGPLGKTVPMVSTVRSAWAKLTQVSDEGADGEESQLY